MKQTVSHNAVTSRRTSMPAAMVLVFQPELSHSVWHDFLSRARTLAGLERQLKAGVKRGDWVAWRLIRIEREVMGNVDG